MSRAVKQTTKILSVVMLTFVMVNCDAGSFIDPVEVETEQEPSTLELDSLLDLITEDDTVALQARVLDQDGDPVDEAEVTWSTTDDRVAEVEVVSGTEATLIAKQPGSATITASYGSLSASTTVDVHPRPVDLVYVSGSGQAGFSGETLADGLVVRVVDKRGDPVSAVHLQLAVTSGGGSVTPEAGQTDVDGYFRSAWTLGGAGSQSVEARASEGQPRVKAIHDSVVVFTAQAQAAIESLEVTPATATLEEGDTLRLEATATASDGSQVSDPQVTWVSTDTTVATVSSTGLLTARQAGAALASATTTSGDTTLSDTTDLSVTEAAATVTGVDLRPDTATVDTSSTQQFDAVALMSDGSETVATVEWSATGGTISSDGLYTAGTTAGSYSVISSHSLGYADTADVTVVAPAAAVARVTVSPSTDTVEVGGTTQLTATVLDGDGNTLTDRTVTWSSSNEAVASVDGTGLVTSVDTGQATITATSEGVSGTAAIAVVSAALGTIEMSPSADTLYGIGDTLTVSATAYDADGSVLSDPGFEWTSDSPDIITVDNMGRLTAKALGTAIISVSAACCAADSGQFVAVDTTAPAMPGQPQVTTTWVSTDTFDVAFDWSGVSDAVAYLWETGTNAGDWKTGGTTADTNVSLSAPRLTNSDGYWVCVKSEDAAGNVSADAACNLYDPPVDTTTAPPGTGSALFSDGFEYYATGSTVQGAGSNGWSWGSVGGGSGEYVEVSDDIALEGSQSLKFHFVGDPAGQDARAEQRFNHPKLKHYWVEFYMYFPDGSEGLGARYEHRDDGGSTNNKFWTVWPEDYDQSNPGGKPSVMFQTWHTGSLSSRINAARTHPDLSYMAYNEPDMDAVAYSPIVDVDGRSDLGRWVQYRIEIKVADYGQHNGIVRLWKDGTLVAETTTDPLYDPNNTTNYLRQGYLLGWANSGFDQDTNIYVDELKFYDTDPAW